MNSFIFLFILIINFLLEIILIKVFVELQKAKNITKRNYRDIELPSSVGASIILISIFNISFTYIIYQFKYIQYFEFEKFILFYSVSIFVSFIGFIDDIFGDIKNKGFKGHIKSFLKEKKISTGFIKMVFIPISVIPIVFYKNNNLYKAIILLLFISLLINLMNLFDLRPGRCLKIFILFYVITIPFSSINITTILPIILAIILIKGDLQEKYMLGDSGSNLFGFYLSYNIIHNCSFNFILIVILLIIVFLLNILSEKISFSKIISSNKVLNFIDMIGRMN
ncbi:hypothetical protein ACAG39_02445 [Caldicellulosiruptoraceae bacterium PP1]